MTWLFICSVADNVFEIAGFEVDATEIETAVRNLQANKSPVPDGLTAEFYQNFREELTLILLKLF